MPSYPFLYLSCILAGFALIKVPLVGLFAPIEPLAFLVGVISILVFSCIIIFNGLMYLFGKRKF